MSASQAPAPASGAAMARGAAWLVGFRLVDRVIGLASTLVLARVLAPQDFGLVAMATAVVGLLELMGAFGFDTALIQRQQAERSHYDTAWTFNLLLGVAIALLLVAVAVPAAEFYGEPRLRAILPVLAIASLAGGAENIGTVAFRKELDFRSEFRFLLLKRLATTGTTLVLAFMWRSHWALVAGIVTGKCAASALSYALHPYRPRPTLAGRAELMHFSKWIFFSSLVQYLHARSTDFILGRTVGSHGLGIYNAAVELANLPSTELIAPVNRAVFPAYARLAPDRAQLWERFLGVYGLICWVAFPVAAALPLLAAPTIETLLGTRWLEGVPVLQIFAGCGLVGALQGNLYVVLVAIGQPRANTLLSAAILAVSLPCVTYASLRWGLVGAAAAHGIVSLFAFAGILLVFRRLTGIGLRRLGACMGRPLVAAGALALAVLAVLALLGSAAPAPLRLLLPALAGTLAYLAADLVLWWAMGRPAGAERTLLDALAARWKRWR